ncbi:MAG: winged helix-turn-helix transcriptional regulator [Candidatus Lokiarchaeota archaeon]|nr:winged helix-turn-helix transcriptional regulator [Candidatus Lokiarchaeota archaeon]MBD3202541.1 winged helix-turn-helix transcriptional regulator [Candidatus Lokiarchaeota archaeon]
MDEFGKLDEIDIKILREMSIDSRHSLRSLGEIIDKSPITIKRHLEAMEKRGIVKDYGITIDYEQLGFDIIALIELTISKGKMLEVEKEIAEDPNVFAVYDITGQYDALILAKFRSRNDLSELVKNINSKEYVIRTNTHLILNVIKEGTSFDELYKKEKMKQKKENNDDN